MPGVARIKAIRRKCSSRRRDSMKPIGVFGGTFDPIHMGHIVPVLDVCEITGIEEVRYVPNARPSHRGAPQSDPEHRMKMTELALQGYPELIADDREIRRSGKSFMVPTLRSMRSEFGLRPLCLILGMDAFLQIRQWYWWSEILRLANIIVMNRPGAKVPNILPVWWDRAIHAHTRVLYERLSGNIIHLDVTLIDVSATRLRVSMARGDERPDGLSDEVADYINAHRLYTASGVAN